jgi:hypothetical protein
MKSIQFFNQTQNHDHVFIFKWKNAKGDEKQLVLKTTKAWVLVVILLIFVMALVFAFCWFYR